MQGLVVVVRMVQDTIRSPARSRPFHALPSGAHRSPGPRRRTRYPRLRARRRRLLGDALSRRLVANLRKSDRIVAAIAGALSDQIDEALDEHGVALSPIKTAPDFEHLEAEGRDILRGSPTRDGLL